MLDELLGRAPLQEEIEQLSAEIEQLEAQLSAESDRRRAAVRDRQAAEERVNDLEDRIAGLEGELQSVKGEREGPTFFHTGSRSYRSIVEYLELVRSVRTSDETALTAAFDEDIPSDVEKLLNGRTELLRSILPCILCIDTSRLIRVAFVPPRQPAPFEMWKDRFELEDQWFLPADDEVFAVVRSDLFAIGSVHSGTISYEDGFTSDVMNTHSKGGFSQARFERRRDEQIREHIDRVEETLAAYDPDSLILTGDHHVLKQLDVTPASKTAVDASGAPRDALTNAFDSFWQTRVFLV